MHEHLFDHLDIEAADIHIPDGQQAINDVPGCAFDCKRSESKDPLTLKRVKWKMERAQGIKR